MLTVTEAAGAHLQELLSVVEAPDEAAVRFVQEDQGLSLRTDQEQPGDESFEHGGRTVLLLDQEMSDLLAERTLDVEETEQGPKLILL